VLMRRVAGADGSGQARQGEKRQAPTGADRLAKGRNGRRRREWTGSPREKTAGADIGADGLLLGPGYALTRIRRMHCGMLSPRRALNVSLFHVKHFRGRQNIFVGSNHDGGGRHASPPDRVRGASISVDYR
jgi:hypothetical protein